MWDNFWKAVIFVALVAALTTCSSCAMGGNKNEDLIEAASDAGCALRAIKFDDGEVKQIDCHDAVRLIR